MVCALFAEWEQTLSRFLPESELSRLNEQQGIPVVASDLLYKVLATALEAAQATRGVFDPAMLDQLVLAGYDRTFDELPEVDHPSPVAILPGGAWRGIRLEPESRRVTLPLGMRIDFGGIAKGMAVDAAIEKLSQNGITPALVNAGGDLAVMGFPPDMKQWPIAVPGWEQSWTVPLLHGAIATSGIARRHWMQGNTLKHHLLDPRTGQPAQSDLWSVTVTADRCEQAEIAAKVAFILGSSKGAAFLRDYRIAGLLVHLDGTCETVDPWPADFMENTAKDNSKHMEDKA